MAQQLRSIGARAGRMCLVVFGYVTIFTAKGLDKHLEELSSRDTTVKFGGDCNNCWSFELRESPENAAYDHQLRNTMKTFYFLWMNKVIQSYQRNSKCSGKKSFWTQPKIDRALELTDAEIVEEHMDANRNEEGGNNKDDKEEEVAEDKHIKSKQHIAKSINQSGGAKTVLRKRVAMTGVWKMSIMEGLASVMVVALLGGILVLLELSKAINRVVKDLGLPIRDERWHSQGTATQDQKDPIEAENKKKRRYKDQKDKDRIRILKGLKDKDRIRTIKGLKDKKGKIKK
ncbi:hypothetical protein BY996DRAFT_6594745 [Phakopsora pachyrhizi]|nr:hypothetical protein BY996DRAFT_6594745 [Phakopsora pachyrhizi]